jgi:hemerythrin-like domain-containing protein
MKPIGPLMIEHRLIERIFVVVHKQARLAVEKKQIDPVFIDTAVDFIRWYADKTHHAKEEAILFRDVAKKDMSAEHRRLMQELTDEHDFGRRTVGRLVEAREQYVRGEGEALNVILNIAETLVHFYREHIRKEDKILFPACMEYLTEQEQESVLREFWESDRTMIHEKYGAVVDQLEKAAQ